MEVELIRSDCGGEFKYRFSEVCNPHQIKPQFIAPDIPHVDRCVECGLAMTEVFLLAAYVPIPCLAKQMP